MKEKELPYLGSRFGIAERVRQRQSPGYFKEEKQELEMIKAWPIRNMLMP